MNKSEQKRIMMITPFHRKQRGNSITSARLHQGLSARGLTVDLYSMEDKDYPQTIFRAMDYDYQLIHGFHARYFTRVLHEVPELSQLPMVLTTTGTDLHFDLQGTEREQYFATLCKMEAVVLFHEDFLWPLVQEMPVLTSKIHIIPQGICLPKYSSIARSELNLTEEDVVFVLPSGFRPVKQIELAIDGLAILAENLPNVKLVIAGPVLDQNYAEPLLKRMCSLSWVHYVGEISRQRMVAVMALSDVVLNTSQAEGQPQGAMEAMSLGKPAILSRVPGNVNLIEESIHGCYVDDAADLARAARVLMMDHAKRRKMGQAAQDLMKRRYSMEDEITAYQQLYKQIGE